MTCCIKPASGKKLAAIVFGCSSSIFSLPTIRRTSQVIASGLFLFTSPAIAATVSWNNSGEDHWHMGSNWNPATMPGSGDTVIINNGGTALINSGENFNITSLAIGNGIGSNGTLLIDSGSLVSGSGLSVGNNGTGTLVLSNGGHLSTSSAQLGIGSTGTGHVTVDGQLAVGSYINVGSTGQGTLVVNSGIVSAAWAMRIGELANSTGRVEVNGGKITSADDNNFVVGRGGYGELEINNNGEVSAAWAFIGGEIWRGGLVAQGKGHLTLNNTGLFSNASGIVLAAGAASEGYATVNHHAVMTTNGALYLGYDGVAELTVNDNGQVRSTGTFAIGQNAGSNGTAVVSGNGTITTQSNLYIGVSGTGSLTLTDGGTASVVGFGVRIADAGSATGTLNIGSAAGHAATAPGALQAAVVSFGNGNGRVVFNHTDRSGNYGFSPAMSGTGSVDVYAGVTKLTAANIYGGPTTISGGSLKAGIASAFSAASSHEVLSNGTLDLNGFDQQVLALSNAGRVVLNGAPGTSLTAGSYLGNGGGLYLNTALGGDASPTDRLVITGDVSGTTSVVVTNRGGLGAQTSNGIQIIAVGDVSPGDAFTLAGDYVTADGQQAVIGGAYAYTLRHNSPTAADGNWYLTSEFLFPEKGPRYQPGVVVFEQYPQVLAALNTVPTLQQRVGTRSGTGQTGIGSGPSAHNYGLWGRIEGRRTASEPDRSTSGAQRDIDLWKLQTGFDFALHQGKDGSLLIGGVTVSYGTAKAELSSLYGRGQIDSTATGLGATLTWYGQNGFYVDGQAQVNWFDSDLTSTTEGRKLVSGNNGHGYALSLETGNRYQLGNGFSLTPQVQLVYSRVDFDSFYDPFNTRVALEDGDSLRARFGIALDHQASWVAADGTNSRSHVYGLINLTNEFLDGSQVDVSGTRFRSRDERLWAGVGLGGTYAWDNGKYALYGTASLDSSLKHFGDSYAVGGTLGFRASW